MIAARGGRIINITSYAGVYRWPLMSAYATSKAALVKLTETLAEETRPHGVAVFSVDPGLLPIGLSESALSSRAAPQTPEGRVHGWIRDQLRSGHGADPAQSPASSWRWPPDAAIGYPAATSPQPMTSAHCSPSSTASSATTCTPSGCANYDPSGVSAR